MAPILTVTLNPALDVTTTTEKLKPQQKLRCDAPRYHAGGGGINVSRAIHELGGESLAFAALGGAAGQHHAALLSASGIAHEIFPVEGETRFSLTVMEDATKLHYRFVLPGPPQTPGFDDQLLARLEQLIVPDCRYVVASGSLLPGIADDFYGRLTLRTRARGARLILDSHGAAVKAAISSRPYLIRVNHLEAQELLGGTPGQAAHQLARELVDREFTEAAIVTLGDRGAIVASAGHEMEIRPPKVVVRSTVGAGDSFVAALTLGLARGWPLVEAARYGVAAAAATVTTEATELCSAETVAAFFAQIGGVFPPD